MRPTVSAAVTAAAATVATIAVAVLPSTRFAYAKPPLHASLETLAAVADSLVAYLVLGRYARTRRLDALLLSVALSLLAAANFAFAAVPSIFLDRPSRFWPWTSLAGHALAATLLAVAALAPSRPIRRPARAAAVAFASAGVVLAAAASSFAAASAVLPDASVGAAPSRVDFADIAARPAVSALNAFTMLAFGAAAVGFAVRSERARDEFLGWVAAGSVLAAFARLHYVLYPSLSSRWFYTGDLLRLLFSLVLLAGAAREITGYWQRLAGAAVLEERRRVAGELHDGLAQEVAFILRRARRLATAGAVPELDEIVRAAERALLDSRYAIAALTRHGDETLDVALAQAVSEVAGRLGVAVEQTLAEGVVVDAGVREALVRIAVEAVANAAQHAEADVVRVSLENGRRLRLTIEDAGQGFEPAEAAGRPGHFGLASMSERARRIGADFAVVAAPGAGTEVRVEL